MEDLEFIKGFTKISVPKICKKVKVDKGNLHKGTCNKEKIKEVRKNIENEIAKLYLLDGENCGEE